MNSSRFILFIFSASILLGLAACSGEQIEEATWPENLKDKKKLLAEKKGEVKKLQEDIARLNKEIGNLDTLNKVVDRRIVTVDTIQKTDFVRYVDVQGSIASDKAVNASSETGGRVLELTVQEGDVVRQGQLIARLDLEQIKKQRAELEVAYNLATTTYERQKRLWDQKIGTEIQFLQAKSQKEQLEKSLASLDFQLSKAIVNAPISGVIDRVGVEAGEIASPGIPIVSIISLSQVKVLADVPENYLRSVKRGNRIEIELPALESVRQARITRIGQNINSANRTFQIEASISNRDGLLKPNLLAVVKLKEFEKKNAIIIPTRIIQQEVDGNSFVYVMKPSPEGFKAEKVNIQTGETSEEDTEVLEGLSDGDIVIDQGARSVANGDLLKLPNGETGEQKAKPQTAPQPQTDSVVAPATTK